MQFENIIIVRYELGRILLLLLLLLLFMISKVTIAEYRSGDGRQANACLTEGREFFRCKILLLCELHLASTPVQLWKTHIVTASYLLSSQEMTLSKPY